MSMVPSWGLILSQGIAPPPSPPGFLNPFSADSMWNTPVATYIAAGAFYGRGDGTSNAPNFAAIPTADGQGIYCDVVYLYDGTAAGTSQCELWYDPPYPARDVGGSSGASASGTKSDSGRVLHLPTGELVPAFSSGVSVTNACFGYYDGTTWQQGNGYALSPALNSNFASTPGLGTSRFNDANMNDIANIKRGNLGGRGASNLSAVGGVLRPGELESITAPPAHCLQFTFPMGIYGRQDIPFAPSNAVGFGWTGVSSIGSGGFVWPAVVQDSGYNGGGAGIGNNYGGAAFGTPWVWMGSLLAIRPADLATVLAGLPFGTQKGKNFANTMCTYGAYISENAASAGAGFVTLALQIDQIAQATAGLKGQLSGSPDANAQADINFVFQKCYVVMQPNQLPPN